MPSRNRKDARLGLQLGGEKRVGFRSSSGAEEDEGNGQLNRGDGTREKEDTRKNLNPGVNEK